MCIYLFLYCFYPLNMKRGKKNTASTNDRRYKAMIQIISSKLLQQKCNPLNLLVTSYFCQIMINPGQE